MATVTLSPCERHSGCLVVAAFGDDRTVLLAALLKGRFALNNQEPWLLMDCGCFFDAPVVGTPHDSCTTFSVQGSSSTCPRFMFAWRGSRGSSESCAAAESPWSGSKRQRIPTARRTPMTMAV